jgi:hypothetical protein
LKTQKHGRGDVFRVEVMAGFATVAQFTSKSWAQRITLPHVLVTGAYKAAFVEKQ